MNRWIRTIATVITIFFSAPVWAFMPVGGMWNIDSEMNGSPGRGFNIEVENEVVVFLYYGYRSDGSSLFYYAAGPIVNNTFSADLLDINGGTPIGAVYRSGTVSGSPGKVTISFSSGKHGLITLPGESPKAISKYNFGYADGPDGLLGTWLLTSTIGTTPFIARAALTTKLGATANGNGAVATSTNSFVCEFQVSGTFAGEVICVNMLSTNMDMYGFKFSGDRGTGVNVYGASGTVRFYESHALRISTKTGAMTGLNDGTETSLKIYSADARPLSISNSRNVADLITVQMKDFSDNNSTPSVYDPAKAAALAAWAAEARAIISSMP